MRLPRCVNAPVLRKAKSLTVPLLPDSSLVALLRCVGVGVSPVVELKRSALFPNSLALFVRSGYDVPESFPLAVVPAKAALSIDKWVDDDKTLLMPSAAELAAALGDDVELLDVVGTALLLSFQLALDQKTAAKNFAWCCHVLDAQLIDNTNDSSEFSKTFFEIHKRLSHHFTTPRFEPFVQAARYVLSSLLLVDGKEEGDVTPATPSFALLVPLIDLTVNKYRGVQNVSVTQLTAADVKVLSKAFQLRGAAQSLRGSDGDDKTLYWVLTSTVPINGGEELSLTQQFSLQRPELWTPLDRLRMRIPM